MPALGAFEQSIKAFIGDLNGPAAARFVADAHRGLHDKVLREQQTRSGVAPGFEHAVDGRRNVPFDNVKPGGRIVTVYDYRREVALFALAALRSASPVSSGRYRRSHIMLVNGQAVADLPAHIRDEDVITITNTSPYSRRLEIGRKRDGSSFVVQVEPRIYERIAKRIVGPRYRNVAAVAFSYIDLANAYRLKSSRRKRKDRGAGQPVRYPAITIKSL